MLKKINQKGFTIIEVLIVLAIAGLILLVVFLAVPALQRNSRNTTMKNDVQNVLGGVSEYSSANSGKLPNTIAGTGTITYSDSTIATENQTSINVQGTTVVSTIAAAPASAPTNGTVQVWIGHRCDSSVNSRAVAAFYSIETASNSTVQQCQDS